MSVNTDVVKDKVSDMAGWPVQVCVCVGVCVCVCECVCVLTFIRKFMLIHSSENHMFKKLIHLRNKTCKNEYNYIPIIHYSDNHF